MIKRCSLDAMNGVRPLEDDTHWDPQQKMHPVHKQDFLQLDNFLTVGYLDIISLTTPLEFHLDGVQPGVLDRLRAGKYPQQASLNLIRQTTEQCRKMVFEFVEKSRHAGLRNLILIHGKATQERAHANIIRSYLARWLMEFDCVQAFCPAVPKHDGAGACYIMLKKSEQFRLDNREKHAKRSC